MRMALLAAALGAAWGGAAGAVAQEAPAPPGAVVVTPPDVPKRAFELLRRQEGVWDATVETFEGPNHPPQVTRGTETSEMGAGGRWLVTDFRSEAQGHEFAGHGILGYDPARRRYVGVWADSEQARLATFEAAHDPESDTLTAWMEQPSADGKMEMWRAVTQWKGNDLRTYTMYAPQAGGKDFPALRIHYRRRK